MYNADYTILTYCLAWSESKYKSKILFWTQANTKLVFKTNLHVYQNIYLSACAAPPKTLAAGCEHKHKQILSANLLGLILTMQS